MLTARIILFFSIYLVVGCTHELDVQNNEVDSFIKNKHLADEFKNFINSERVSDLCTKSTNCVLEIIFFHKNEDSFVGLSAGYYKSITPPGKESIEHGFVLLDSKYVLVQSNDLSIVDEFIRMDALNPEIPKKLNMEDHQRHLLSVNKIFKIEGNRLVEQAVEITAIRANE